MFDVMSALLYIHQCQVCFTWGAGVSFEEKRAWIYAVVAAGVSLVYFATVLGQVRPARRILRPRRRWRGGARPGTGGVRELLDRQRALPGIRPRRARLFDHEDRRVPP